MVVSFIGCMVGAGNIWRFPRIAANNSGDAGALQFILVWILFLFLWSLPMLVIEYAVGRYCKCSPVGFFKSLVGPYTVWMGGWIAAVSTAIGCYYAVLCSWCFYYLYFCIVHTLPNNEADSYAVFQSFAEESHWVLIPQCVIVMLSGVTVLWGVKTIEKVNAVIVPLFLILLVFTFIWSLTLPHASKGLKFLFTPDWGRLATPQIWIDAASQNAFDTGAGWGLMTSYAAFMTKDNAILKLSLAIPLGNNLISLMSGMMTFATVFSVETSAGLNQTEIVNILQSSGPANTGLTFIWMPILYSTIKGGKVLAIIFFLALSLALFSTEIAILELSLKSIEDLGVKRKYIVPPLCAVVFLIGVGSAVKIDYLVNQDLVWSYALLLSGMSFIYMVYRYGSNKLRSELINEYSTSDWYLPKIWEWMIKFIAPLEVALLLGWFTVDQIVYNSEWYKVNGDNLMSCIVQWTAVIILTVLFNIIYVKYLMPSTPTPAYGNMMSDMNQDVSGNIQLQDEKSSQMTSQ
ncbi:putative sodium-dependent transporter HI_0736 [Glandiceps talaboti]